MALGRKIRKGWGLLASWRWLATEGRTLLWSAMDPRTPWYAKLAAMATVLYVVNPLDIVPEFLPFVGLVDDLLVLPLGLALVRKLIPEDVWAQHSQHIKRVEKGQARSVPLGRSTGMRTVGRGRA